MWPFLNIEVLLVAKPEAEWSDGEDLRLWGVSLPFFFLLFFCFFCINYRPLFNIVVSLTQMSSWHPSSTRSYTREHWESPRSFSPVSSALSFLWVVLTFLALYNILVYILSHFFFLFFALAYKEMHSCAVNLPCVAFQPFITYVSDPLPQDFF